jgi:hypothetical protein
VRLKNRNAKLRGLIMAMGEPLKLGKQSAMRHQVPRTQFTT